jgi:hypothetical protein
VNAIYEATVKLLGDDLPSPALQQSLSEGLNRLGRDEKSVSYRDMEKVLKSSVYRQLQVHLPAALAKTRIQQILTRLSEFDQGDPNPSATSASVPDGLERQSQLVTALDDAQKRFNLYFEWPEVQKFRAQLSVIRDQHMQRKAVPELVRDAQTQLEGLERKLQELLVRQAREIADLQAELERVRSIGGPRIKRLQSMITQITQAQTTSTLAPAEVERARKLAIELRKLVESSVVTAPVADAVIDVDDTPTTPEPRHGTSEFLLDVEFAGDDAEFQLDFTDLSPEQSERMREIDLKEEYRTLELLGVEYRAVLENAPELTQRLQQLRERNQQRELLRADLESMQSALQDSRMQMLEAQRARLHEVQSFLDRFGEAGLDIGEAQLTHSVATGMVGAGVLASDDVRTLEDLLRTLERQYEDRLRARAEEQARLERLLLRQDSILTEMRSAAAAFASLGSAATAQFQVRLSELEAESRARVVREDLSRQLVEDAKALQTELDQRETEMRAEAARREADARAEAERRAAEQRAAEHRAEIERREAEARLLAERAEAERRENERREQLQREMGLLRGLRVNFSSLPDLPELSAKTKAFAERLTRAAAQLEAGDVLDEEITSLQVEFQELTSDYSLTFSDKVADLETQAREQGATEVIMSLQAAREQLQIGTYPELSGLESALRSHREARLTAQRRELAELEATAREYLVLPDAVPLLAMINQARAGHDLGKFVEFAEAWDVLDALRAAEEQRLSEWGSRVDAITSEADTYRRVGGETVRQLVRMVDLLRTERQMPRINPETRLRLERTVSEAEALLVAAREEHAAASAVAAALQDSSNLEGLLGLFDTLTPKNPTVEMVSPQETAVLEPIESSEPEPEPHTAPVVAAVVADGSGVPEHLRSWIEHLGKERGVAQVALVGLDGTLELGSLERPDELVRLIEETERYNLELSQELHRKPARLTTVEFAGGAVITCVLRGSSLRVLIVRIEDATAYSRVFSQMLRDHEQLMRWVE